MHPILHKSAQKIKPFQNHILLCSTIGLLCICSFSLGYIYHAYSQKARNATNMGLRIEYPPYVTDLMKDGPYRPISSIVQGSRVTTGQNGQGVGEAGQLGQNLVSTAGNFAASNSGTVYYPANCKALSRVHEENRIYFSSSAEAEELGYTLSKSCD